MSATATRVEYRSLTFKRDFLSRTPRATSTGRKPRRPHGANVVAIAAYITGQSMEDGALSIQQGMRVFRDYSRRKGVLYHETVVPDSAPAWARDPEQLWNAVEARENRKNSVLGDELTIAVPHELSPEAQIAFARKYVQENFVDEGYGVTWALHVPHRHREATDGTEQDVPGNDKRNFHLHIMHTRRKLTQDGWAHYKDDRHPLEEAERTRFLSEAAQRGINRALEMEGIKHVQSWFGSWKNLAEHGRNLGDPELVAYAEARDATKATHLGPKVISQAHRGIEMDEMRGHREIVAQQRDVDDIHRQRAVLHAETIALEAELAKRQAVELAPDAAPDEEGASYRFEGTATSERELLKNPDRLLRTLTKHEATFTWQRLEIGIADRVTSQEGFDAISARLRVSRELHLAGRDGHGIDQYTTATNYKNEQRFSSALDDLIVRKVHAPSFQVRPAGEKFSEDQRAGVESFVSGKGYAQVIGRPGSGKTTMMREVAKGFEAQGREIIAGAPTGIAAERLAEGVGGKAATLHSLLMQWSGGNNLPTANTVLVIDEAAMVDTKIAADVFDTVRKHGGVIRGIFDLAQLPPVAAGHPLRLAFGKAETVELREVHRQQVEWQRQATMDMADGDFVKGLNAYVDASAFKQSRTEDETRQKIVERFDELTDNGRDSAAAIIWSPSRDAAADLATRVQALRVERGQVTNVEKFVTRYRDEDKVWLDDRWADRDVLLGKGDRLRFRETDKEMAVKNGMAGTVERIAGQRITVRLDPTDGEKQGREISFNARKFRSWELAYASTIHVRQGSEAAHVIGHLTPSGALNRNTAYVGFSRHKDSLELFWSEEKWKKGLPQIIAALTTSREKTMALDFEGQRDLGADIDAPIPKPGDADSTARDQRVTGMGARVMPPTPAEHTAPSVKTPEEQAARVGRNADLQENLVRQPSAMQPEINDAPTLPEEPTMPDARDEKQIARPRDYNVASLIESFGKRADAADDRGADVEAARLREIAARLGVVGKHVEALTVHPDAAGKFTGYAVEASLDRFEKHPLPAYEIVNSVPVIDSVGKGPHQYALTDVIEVFEQRQRRGTDHANPAAAGRLDRVTQRLRDLAEIGDTTLSVAPDTRGVYSVRAFLDAVEQRDREIGPAVEPLGAITSDERAKLDATYPDGWKEIAPDSEAAPRFLGQPARVVSIDRDEDGKATALLGYHKNSNTGKFWVMPVRLSEQRVGIVEPEMTLRVDPKLGHYATPERTMARKLAEPKIAQHEIKGPGFGVDY